MHRRAVLIGLPLAALAACSAEPVWAPDDQVARVSYRGEGPTSLTLYTMKNIGSGNGAHSSILVNASQRVMFDPAGTFGHASIPERNDVLFGMTPRIEAYYVSYHARATYYVIGQKIIVAPDVAETALQLVLANGAVPKAHCTRATSRILRQLPGFSSLPVTYFPNTLADAFGKLPGVVTTEYRENDADDKSVAAAQIDVAIRSGQ
jgi:hypothetical protein